MRAPPVPWIASPASGCSGQVIHDPVDLAAAQAGRFGRGNERGGLDDHVRATLYANGGLGSRLATSAKRRTAAAWLEGASATLEASGPPAAVRSDTPPCPWKNLDPRSQPPEQLPFRPNRESLSRTPVRSVCARPLLRSRRMFADTFCVIRIGRETLDHLPNTPVKMIHVEGVASVLDLENYLAVQRRPLG